MNKDKVYLKGYVIGRVADTLGYEGLMVQLENLNVVEIDKNLVHKKIDEPQLIKLKDVIARIKDFDSGTQIVWLDAILNELGSDYGILKYKTGYEQGRFEGEYVGQQLKDADKVRQKLNKPVVKQFVADWYEEHKSNLDYELWNYVIDWEDQKPSEFKEWFNKSNKAFQTLVNMHQFGYTVEKEPKYTVKVKATKQYLSNDEIGPHFDPSFRSNFTKSDLEELGLGWVFDCEGMEVEKVGK